MGRILIGNVKGPAATVRVGAVNTGEPGSSALVTNTGTSKDAVFDFTIPRGAQGQQGVQGPTGPMPPLINNLLTNQAGAGALDAYQGKVLAEKDAEIADQVSELNSNSIKRSEYPMYFRGYLNQDDLNTYNTPDKAGFYWQGLNNNATPEIHYPFKESGILEILPGVGGAGSIFQRYTGYETGKVGIRCYRDGYWVNNGTWKITTPDS